MQRIVVISSIDENEIEQNAIICGGVIKDSFSKSVQRIKKLNSYSTINLITEEELKYATIINDNSANSDFYNVFCQFIMTDKIQLTSELYKLFEKVVNVWEKCKIMDINFDFFDVEDYEIPSNIQNLIYGYPEISIFTTFAYFFNKSIEKYGQLIQEYTKNCLQEIQIGKILVIADFVNCFKSQFYNAQDEICVYAGIENFNLNRELIITYNNKEKTEQVNSIIFVGTKEKFVKNLF